MRSGFIAMLTLIKSYDSNTQPQVRHLAVNYSVSIYILQIQVPNNRLVMDTDTSRPMTPPTLYVDEGRWSE